jgi:hypothetical protein
MADVTFADLVEIYRATQFGADGEGVLTVGSDHMIATLRAIMDDDDLYRDAQIALIDDVEPAVGDEVRISIGQPHIEKMGLLMPNFDALFRSPKAVFQEPERYYVIDAAYASGDIASPEMLLRYRALLGVMSILRESASYIDETMRELVFIGKEKVVIPMRIGVSDLGPDVVTQTERLWKLFEGELHLREKRTILQTTLIEMLGLLRLEMRAGFVVRNLDLIADEVEKGYRLFASSFSYSKIRNDVETARIEFVGKIHKTIVDIQGQLLGIPVATVVVVSQLKVVSGCNMTFWANVGVLVGAWIFVGMLSIAVANQWKTLTVISEEIRRQEKRLKDDFALVANQFSDIYEDLAERICWHQKALMAVSAVLAIGAAVTMVAFVKLMPQGSAACFAFWR